MYQPTYSMNLRTKVRKYFDSMLHAFNRVAHTTVHDVSPLVDEPPNRAVTMGFTPGIRAYDGSLKTPDRKWFGRPGCRKEWQSKVRTVPWKSGSNAEDDVFVDRKQALEQFALLAYSPSVA
jgi:hypothetical protein